MLDLLPTLQVLIVPEPLWHYLDVNGINKSELLSTDFLLRNNGVENTAMLFYVNSLYNSPVFKNKFDFSHYPETYKYPTSVTSSLDLQQLQSRVEGMQLEAKDFYDFFPTTVNTFRPFMISERVVGLIPVTDLETNFKQRLDGFFGVLRACNVPTTLLAKLPYFKQHIQEALKTTSSVNVSQESLAGSALVGVGLGAAFIASTKLFQLMTKNNSKLPEAERIDHLSLQDQVKKVIEHIKNSNYIKGYSSVRGYLLGSPTGNDCTQLVAYLRKSVLEPSNLLLDRTEQYLQQLHKVSPTSNEREFNAVEERLFRAIRGAMGSGTVIAQWGFKPRSGYIETFAPPSDKLGTYELPIKPGPYEEEVLVPLMVDLLSLHNRLVLLPNNQHAPNYTEWYGDLAKAIKDVLVEYNNFLFQSYERIVFKGVND